MRLLYLVSHPIQYQAPLLRFIADAPDIHLKVLFENITSMNSYYDPGFRTEIAWDTNLNCGYEYYHISRLSQIIEYLNETDVFWLHGWDSSLKLRALNAAWRRNVPVLMRGENTLTAMPDGRGIRGVLKRFYLRWIFDRCTSFMYIGSDNRDYYLAHGVNKDRLFHMPYAVDNHFFSQSPQHYDHEIRDAFGLEEDRPVILFLGKLSKRKNPGLLINACQLMNRQRARNPYLLIVGSGEEEPKLHEIAANLNWVKFLGFRNQSELPAIYSLADVFVMPSYAEPWGLAVNEAMASGTAVISTIDCGCSKDLIDDAVGRVVPANDRFALARAIEEVLVDEEKCSAMGRAAHKRIASWSFAEDLKGLKEAIRVVAAVPNST